MIELGSSIWVIAPLFFLVALAYASVGLAGGSTYTAMLVLLGFSHQTVPLVSLSLNLIVSTMAAYHFIQRGHLHLSIALPFLLASIPMAWLGGGLAVSPALFQWLLWGSLLVIVIRIYFRPRLTFGWQAGARLRLGVSLVVGAVLGLLSGIVGIGGGIYLVPIIVLFGFGTIQQAAACGAVFIWLNSLVGLSSRLLHHDVALLPFWPLIAAVSLGGLLGATLGAKRLAAEMLERILGVIMLLALVLLSHRLLVA